MGLRIVTGGANAGKTGALYTAIRKSAEQGKEPVLLLPSAPEAQRAEDEFARKGSAFGVEITQFDLYLERLWTLLGDGRTLVRATQRTLLVSAALAQTTMTALAASASRPGFVRVAERLVQRAGESLALDGRRASFAAKPAARELLVLVDAYAALLAENGLVEPAEAHRLAADKIERADLPDLIAINRFSSFTPAQRRFIERCADLGCRVQVGLTWVEGLPATLAAEVTLSQLMRVPGAECVSVEGGPGQNEELDALAEQLFAEARGLTPPVPSGSVTLSEAAGLAGEAARITRDIQEMVISGIAYGDIAVVFRNPEPHVARVSAAFEEAGIPADIDSRAATGASGLGRALLLLLSYLCRGRKRADLMGFLRSGYSWAEPRLVDAADEALRRQNVDSGPAVTPCERSVGPKTRLLLERAVQLADARVDASTIPGWRWLIADMLRASHGPSAVFDERGMVDAATQRTVLATVEDIAALRGPRCTASELLRVLEGARVTLAPGRTRGNHVQVMSAERARSRRFSAVILGGLNAGEFPELPAEDALTAPGLAGELLSAGIDMSPRVDMDAERMLFYQVVTGARSRLVLSRMVCDDDGRPMRPSPLWEEFLDLYRDPVTGKPYHGTALPVRRLELADFAETDDAPVAERRRLRAAAAGTTQDEPRIRYARYRSRPRSGCVDSELVAEFAATDTFSATELEAYLGCPFRWFYEKRLHPERLDQQIDALEKGTLAHRIMQRFYEARAAEGLGRVTSANAEEALALHRAVAALALAESPRPSSLSEEEMLHAAVVASRRIVERDAAFLPAFEPVENELRFNTKQWDPPIELGSFFLKGRIDRIDACSSGIVVIDYKTGSSVPKKKDLERQQLVQLPLYALVAAKRLQRPVFGGLYRSMQYGGDRGFFAQGMAGAEDLVRGDACEPEEFADLLDAAVARSERAVAGIRAGTINPAPRDRDACRCCPAASACGGRPS